MDIRVKLMILQWPNCSTRCWRHPFYALCAVFNCILEPTGSSFDVVSGRFVRLTVPDKFVKFRDRRLNRSSEILAKAVGGSIVDSFSNFDKCRLEVAADAISGNWQHKQVSGLNLQKCEFNPMGLRVVVVVVLSRTLLQFLCLLAFVLDNVSRTAVSFQSFEGSCL